MSSSSLLLCLIIVPPFASRDLVFATNQGAVAPIRERSLPPDQNVPHDLNRPVQQESDRQGQHPSFQNLEASTPVHLTLDNFESIDLALDRSVVPGRFDRQLHRTKIAAQGSGELRQKIKPRARHRRNPLRQPASAPPAQHRTKLQGKFAHSIGAGTEAQKAVTVSLLQGAVAHAVSAIWLAFWVIQTMALMPLNLFPNGLLLAIIGIGIFDLLLAVPVGIWLYEER
jgi:hypothetical protein